jgi:hypothetical protein
MVQLKKISVLSFTLLAVFLFPFSTAHAALTTVGSYNMTYNADLQAYVTPIPTFTSDGGDVKVCISGASGPRKTYYLMEYDPGKTGSGVDDIIGTALLIPGECYKWSVAGNADGDNGKAEIYVKSYAYTVKATIYD